MVWLFDSTTGSLRRRLMLQLLCVAALLSALLYFAVRSVANQAAIATHDNILGASATSIAEQVSSVEGEITIDIPYSAFSMLGAISEDRVFYHVLTDGDSITGYEELVLPQPQPQGSVPFYYTTHFKGAEVRAAAVTRVIPIDNNPVRVYVLVAQTRMGQDSIAAKVANTAAALGIGFFLIAGVLSWIATQSTVKPLYQVADALGRRGAHDLRPLRLPVPQELEPLIEALNSFIARLRGALHRTETFIAEAAHHVRTPLATVRTQADIALRQAETDESRQTLRSVIRAVDESSRSATQLLDHAMVTYRSDQMAREKFDLTALVRDVVRSLNATAELKELTLEVDLRDGVEVTGDRVLIASALHNILDNAIKYSPEETVISVLLESLPVSHTFRVCDQGRGLAGAKQSSLTERFTRGQNVNDIVGSGLGLTIVDEVAVAHGGSFKITPREGRGTCALLELPQ